MKQRKALAAAIQEVGFIRSVTVNKPTGRLIDGHERVWQALTNEEPFIDVEYVELSEADEAKALALMDAIGELAEPDPELLDQLLREIETGSEELQELLAEMAEQAGVLPAPGEDDSAGIDLQGGFEIVVTCDDESDQQRLYERLIKEGKKCRVLTF